MSFLKWLARTPAIFVCGRAILMALLLKVAQLVHRLLITRRSLGKYQGEYFGARIWSREFLRKR